MAHTEWPLRWGLPAYPEPAPMGWSCPSCHRCYAPHMVMCSYCPPKPVTSTGTCAGTADITITSVGDPPGSLGGGSIATRVNYGYGSPCPRPQEGGTCGCDEDDDAPPKVCLGRECDCV